MWNAYLDSLSYILDILCEMFVWIQHKSPVTYWRMTAEMTLMRKETAEMTLIIDNCSNDADGDGHCYNGPTGQGNCWNDP